MFLPGLFRVMHHSLSRCSAPGQCLIHVFRESWMRWLQKPLVSSSSLSTASSHHFHFLSLSSATLFTNHFLYFCFPPSSPHAVFDFSSSLYTFIPFSAFCHLSLSTSHILNMLFSSSPPCTCSHSYDVHWCHLSASSETQHIKISVSLARTFRPPWIIQVCISALHPWPREKCFYFQPQVMKSG